MIGVTHFHQNIRTGSNYIWTMTQAGEWVNRLKSQKKTWAIKLSCTCSVFQIVKFQNVKYAALIM